MNLSQLLKSASEDKNKVIAVAGAEDREVLEAVYNAIQHEMASFLLFGNQIAINQILKEKNMAEEDYVRIIDVPDGITAAKEAVKAVSTGQADILMKGLIPTSLLLKEVLNKEYGLRSGNVLSHVAAFEIPEYKRLIFVTDAAMNIAPDLKQKSEIIHNAVNLARDIGIITPKVAVLAAVETINLNMPATIDAAALVQMSARGQLSNCIVDGPLALDNAISIEAANHKGIQGHVAGNADILMVPSIEVGNVLYKSLIYFAKATVGAIITGAKSPIVLTSRADSAESKLYSIALAVSSIKPSRKIE